MRALALALSACALVNGVLAAVRPSRAPDPLGLRVAAESAVETASFLALGLRRLAADVENIRMIIYYGTPESDDEREHGHANAPEPESGHAEGHYGGGQYPELRERAQRILDLDPAFMYPALYAAGALAFNLNRPQEALDLLQYALERDPGNRQYQYYIGAVGFHRHGDPQGVIRLLEPVLQEPDCPSMIRSMVAYLYVKAGRKADAIKLYRQIAESSRDADYRHIARDMLKRLGAE